MVNTGTWLIHVHPHIHDIHDICGQGLRSRRRNSSMCSSLAILDFTRESGDWTSMVTVFRIFWCDFTLIYYELNMIWTNMNLTWFDTKSHDLTWLKNLNMRTWDRSDTKAKVMLGATIVLRPLGESDRSMQPWWHQCRFETLQNGPPWMVETC